MKRSETELPQLSPTTHFVSSLSRLYIRYPLANSAEICSKHSGEEFPFGWEN
jgi:hypothetical protein